MSYASMSEADSARHTAKSAVTCSHVLHFAGRQQSQTCLKLCSTLFQSLFSMAQLHKKCLCARSGNRKIWPHNADIAQYDFQPCLLFNGLASCRRLQSAESCCQWLCLVKYNFTFIMPSLRYRRCQNILRFHVLWYVIFCQQV